MKKRKKQDSDAAWLAYILAVASFVVPGFVSRSRDLNAEREKAEHTFCLDAALDGELSPTSRLGLLHFFEADTLPGITPCRNFFMRCLVAKVDEQGLSALAEKLPALVGKWVTPYLQQQIDPSMLALLAVPHFQEQLLELRDGQEREAWVEALPRALGGQHSELSPQVHSSRTPSAARCCFVVCTRSPPTPPYSPSLSLRRPSLRREASVSFY